MIKKIFCYGDSNTWGYSPHGAIRFESSRWTQVLKRKSGHIVFENGLNGRTVTSNNDISQMSAEDDFIAHKQLIAQSDILIYYLGINDLLVNNKKSPYTIVATSEKLLNVALKINKKLRVILVAPLHLHEEISVGCLSLLSSNVSQLKELYHEMALSHGFTFFDPDKVISASKIDNVHIEELDHLRFGNAMCKIIKNL